MDIEFKKRTIIDALEDVKGKDIQVLDVSRLTTVTDCMIIACGDSNRQARALVQRVEERLKAQGEDVLSVEGLETGEWVLLDAGDVIVHIMQPAVRQYYNLETLWGGRPYPQPQARIGLG